MSKARILDPSESYTFSKYAELAFDSADILAEFGVTLKNTLAKTIRDNHEASRITARINEAKVEKLLSEHHPLK